MKRRIVCIDDFATKKRYTYGTVMVDAETGEVVDMLESRGSAEVSEWLASFGNIQVVCRDGSMMYAAAIRTAHPGAVQVSYRFHILKGLTDAAKQFVLRLVGQRIAIPTKEAVSSYWQKQTCMEADLPQRLHDATTEKRATAFAQVRELAAKGLNITQISKETGHSWATTKKYLGPDFEPASPGYGVNHPSKLKLYFDTIDAMLNEQKKFREIEEKIRVMGFRGSASTIRMYATPQTPPQPGDDGSVSSKHRNNRTQIPCEIVIQSY